MNKLPPAILSAFADEDYDAVLQMADKLPADVRRKVICTVHVKTQDCDALDTFLASDADKDLAFFRAYADYSQKRNAEWFLTEGNSHPRATVLKQ